MKNLAKKIRRIGLIANVEKAHCRGLVRKAVTLIRRSGRTAVTEEATQALAGVRIPTVADAPALTRDADLLVVFGGDGTMLRVAREIAGSTTPILGVNAGGLGFLTDVQEHQLALALRQVWAGETRVQTLPLIQAKCQDHGKPISMLALNDFVISRGAAPRLTELEVSVDDEIMTRYRCDGLIVCSPTGSTAYSLAAGGAVVSPGSQVFTITPICPHTLSNRSVIVSLKSTIQVRVISRRVETVLTADGQTTFPLATGDRVTIKRSRHSIRLLQLPGNTFFGTLRRKLKWSGSHVR